MKLTDSNTKPKLKTGCAQPYVAIPACLALGEWGKAYALAKEVALWISTKNIKIAGPLFYRYGIINRGSGPLHLEVGFPVCTAVEGEGRVIAGVIPQGIFATLIHCGHPHRVYSSFDTLQNWANERDIEWQLCRQGINEAWAGRFEFYLTNQANERNKNKWRTAIAVLIAEQVNHIKISGT